MINQALKVERKKAEEYPPLPKDIYQVELLDINTEEKATYDTRNLPPENQTFETVFNFQFTILDHRELRGRNIWENFVPTYLYISKKNGKNKLFRIIEAFIGHEMTKEEEASCDSEFLNKLIGKQCRLSVGPVEKNGRVFDRIQDFIPAYDLLTPLSAAEKDKAKVKNKPGQESIVHEETTEEILKKIPF